MLFRSSHYRSPVSVNPETIGAAERALAGLDTFARRAFVAGVAADAVVADAVVADAVDGSLITAFRERMDDDLDTASAMAIVFDAARRGNAAIDSGDLVTAASLAGSVATMCNAVGLVLKTVDDVPADVLAKAEALDAARAAKDFAAADAIRADLQAEGWLVETTKSGTTVRR